MTRNLERSPLRALGGTAVSSDGDGSIGIKDAGLHSGLHSGLKSGLPRGSRAQVGKMRPIDLMMRSPLVQPDGIAFLIAAHPFHHSKVPEGLTTGGADLTGPRSPYNDSLAALHEIATSPSSYAPPGLLAGDASKLHLGGGAGAGVGGPSQGSGRSGAHVTITSPMFQGLSSPLLMVRAA